MNLNTNSQFHPSPAACMIRMAAVSYCFSHIAINKMCVTSYHNFKSANKEYFISPCQYKETEGLDVKTDFWILPRVSEAFQKNSFLKVHFYI